MPDQIITCQRCHQPFVFSEGEQVFYTQKNLKTPQHCPICRSILQNEAKHPPKPKA